MVHAKNKGSSYERKIRLELREMGWDKCETSRFANRERDNELVDLVNTEPFNFQLKATERSPSYHTLLNDMPKDGNINAVIHKRNRQGEVVVLMKEDFYKLIAHESKKAQQKKQGKDRGKA